MRRPRWLDEARPDGEHDRLELRVDAEFPHQILQVSAYSVHADAELAGGFFSAESGRQEPKNLQFTRTQRLEIGLGRPGWTQRLRPPQKVGQWTGRKQGVAR